MNATGILCNNTETKIWQSGSVRVEGCSYCQSVLVDGNSLDQVPALDSRHLVPQQVLHHHIRQVVPVGIPADIANEGRGECLSNDVERQMQSKTVKCTR